MFSKKFEIGLLLVAVMVFGGLGWFRATTVSASENETNAAPEAPKFALMIGINNYKEYPKNPRNKVRDLRGTNNDVEMMKNLLVNTYGFKYEPDSKTSPIKILLNADATQQGIRDAFRSQIIENAKKYKETAKVSANDGATVVFYYSGHGAKLDDDNGDESDGVDETIMPHDTAVDRKDNKDIRDDEFDAWFTELKNYTTNITFIFDSCHSGTVTRGGNNKSIDRELDTSKSSSRGGEEQVKDGMTTNINEKSKGGSKGGDSELSRNESYVTVSGSLPQEESQEDIFIDPNNSEVKQWNGALTYSIVHLLEKNPDITYREMIKAVQNKVTAMQKNQTPQAEGDIDRKMFGSSKTRGKTPIFIESSKLVTKMNGEGEDARETELFEVNMKVGSIIGAGNGAAVAVFAKKNGGKVREQIGSGMVVSSTEFDSKAEILLDDKTVKQLPKDAIINIISPSFTDKAERLIAFDYPPTTSKGGAEAAASITTKVFDYVRSKLDTKKVVKTVESSSIFKTFFGSKGAASPDWDFAVINGTYKEFKYGNSAADLKAGKSGSSDDPCAQTKPEKETDKGFFIVNRDGMPIYNLWFNETDEGTGDCLADTITKVSRIENLRILTSGESELNNQFKVEIVRLAKYSTISETKCEIAEVSPEQQEKDQKETVQMKADDTYYLKVSNNSPKDLYVYIYSLTTSGKISLLYPPEGADEGEKLLAGKSFKTIDKLGVGNCAAFYIESPEESPPGLETVKVIATTKPFPAKMLEQPSIAKGLRGEGINALIEQAASGTRSGTRKVNVSDWTTKEINIDIVR